MGSAPKAVSLLQELLDVEHMLMAAYLLVEAIESPPFPWTEKEAPSALNTVLIYMVDRLRLLTKAIQGEVNPALLWNARNRAVPADEGESPFVLHEWTLTERLDRAKAEVAHLRARLKRPSALKVSHSRRRPAKTSASSHPKASPLALRKSNDAKKKGGAA